MAVTLKKSECLVLFDKDGNRVASIISNDKQAGKSLLVVTADRSVRIKREKREGLL
jgi:hypothetical protein